mmetsp:Transcript_13776/g.20772  ORF Transcript_13776/g.20772 Transcript_13776/m.20772 type:complete len:452 (-) Transcript_13776:155-1510(-)
MVKTRTAKRKSSSSKLNANVASAKRTLRDVSDDEAVGSDRPLILVPPREDDFNMKTWWMVDLAPVEEASPQGASALVKRCMRMHGWDEAKARKVLASYRQFIILKKNLQDWNAEILSPCYLVDQMWHCHILDVVNYCHDMMLLCGHVVGHNPDGALDYAAKQERDDTTRASLQDHFGSYDKEVWDYSPDAASADANGVAIQLDNAANEEEELVISFMIKIRINLPRWEQTLLEEVSKTTRMGDVFDRYAARKEVSPDRLIFTRNGEIIDANQTVADLGLDVNDLIDCVYDPETINIRFQSYDDREFTINIRRTDMVRRAFDEFLSRSGISEHIDMLRFEFNGDEVHPDSTPENLRMTDNDLIRCSFGANEANEAIVIFIKHQCGEVTRFRVRRSVRMMSIFRVYARRKGMCAQSFRFIGTNGEVIDPALTLARLGLADGDRIDCYLDQRGC